MTEISKAQDWWRWPLMPVAAIAGATAGSVVAMLLFWLSMKFQGGFSEDGWFFLYVLPVISSAVFGYLYTHISCEMAPRGKVAAGIVMVTILGIFCLINIYFAWATPDYPAGQAIQVTVGIVATMVAAVLTLMDANGKYRASA